MALETLIESLPSLLDGLVVTLLLTAFGILLGTTLGIVLATGRSYAKRPIAYLILIYEKVLRGIPLLVLLFPCSAWSDDDFCFLLFHSK